MEILPTQKNIIDKYCYIPSGELYRRFTYAFIHQDILHAAINAICFALFLSWHTIIIFFLSIPFCTLFSKHRIIGASGPVMAMCAYQCADHGYYYAIILYGIYSMWAIENDKSNIHHLSHLLGSLCGTIFYIFES